MLLDVEKIISLICSGGPLSKSLRHFEPRESQQKMMRNVLEAYNKKQIALIEAGTGTGKSLAYLLPAILWALQNKEITVISTNTIALQEQLLNKDLPLLAKALSLDFKAVLVKGMGNYICKRKLEDARQQLRLIPDEESQEIERIDAKKDSLQEGSRSELGFYPSLQTWEKINAEHDTCTHQQCPYFEECFFFKARKEANSANIIIANHHLLFADLAYRFENDNYKDQALLPPYNRLILDEAHHIEDVATEYFSSKASQITFLRNLARISSEKFGKLILLKNKLQETITKEDSRALSSIFTRLDIELPAMRNDLVKCAGDAFYAFAEFAANGEEKDQNLELGISDAKLRMRPHHHQHPVWLQEVLPTAQEFYDSILRFVQAISGLEVSLNGLNHAKLEEQTKSLRFEILALSGRLTKIAEFLTVFLKEQADASSVRWIESQTKRTTSNVHIANTKLDIAKSLADAVFSKFSTVILCSATIATNKHFHFMRKRMGLTKELLPERFITENVYDSPFDYEKQSLFVIPNDIPHPLSPKFLNAAIEKIWDSIEISQGNAFILFTSYSMLNDCYEKLYKRLQENKYFPLKQGEDHRQSLLNRFKLKNRSILFGTDSFWEGVDVVGDALRCVIIVKLPFKVPSEPIIEARAEAITEEGGNAFMEYSLPNAIVKFKQGFGRLIRNKKDRGCIVCLDSRLLTRQYGKVFLNSLPNCQFIFSDSNTICKKMAEFYRKTYYNVLK